MRPVIIFILSLICSSVLAQFPGEELDFTVLEESSDEESKSEFIPVSTETPCYSNDARLHNLSDVLTKIRNNEEIDPLVVKIGTYLEFSSAYIEEIGHNNIHIVTENCATYPTSLTELPFKIALEFEEIFNRLMPALRNKDLAKIEFITKNTVARPLALDKAISLIGQIEITYDEAQLLRQYTSTKPVRNTTNKFKLDKGEYSLSLIPLDVFKSQGGKVVGSNLHIGLAQYGMGAICPGMQSSYFYKESFESTGWLPNIRDKDEPYLRVKELLSSLGIDVVTISCKEYLQAAGRL